VKASDLHAVWSAPDNTRLTAKQTSIRLPIHVAAKLSALCDLYPHKTRTQIIGDLLAAAIDGSVQGIASVKGRFLGRIEPPGMQGWYSYEEVGPLGRFKDLANRHYVEYERELGNESLASCILL
jgi:hypothetical protein